MIKPIRRIVTGHNAQGKSIFVSDGPSPHVLTLPGRGDFALTNLWVTDRAPANNAGNADAAARPVVLEPPANGSIFRVVEFPSEKTAGGFDRGAAFKAMGADHAMDPSASRHPGMHKTSSVDYAIVLSGEILALMDEGETLMKTGDCLVQRGTNHAWSNQRRAVPRRVHPDQRDTGLVSTARATRGARPRPSSRAWPTRCPDRPPTDPPRFRSRSPCRRARSRGPRASRTS